MNVQLLRIYAVIIGVLAVLGLFANGHLFQLMNTDIVIDLLRVVLAAYLVYAGFVTHSERMATTALTVVGGLYIVIGIAGLFNPTIGGLLPSGLTGFDIAFHLLTGLLAVSAVLRHVDTMHMSRA